MKIHQQPAQTGHAPPAQNVPKQSAPAVLAGDAAAASTSIRSTSLFSAVANQGAAASVRAGDGRES